MTDMVEELRYLGHQNSWEKKTPTIIEAEIPSMKARLALNIAQKWGAVAGVPDGEDSAGRSKLRLQTPEELVDRACETASRLIDAIRSRGWVLRIPEDDIQGE